MDDTSPQLNAQILGKPNMPLRKIQVFDASSEFNEKQSGVSGIKVLFDPLITQLKLFGCHSSLLGKYRERKTHKWTCKSIIHLLYCLTLITFLWFNLVCYTLTVSQEIQNGLTAGLSIVLFSCTTLLAYALLATSLLWTLSGELRKTIMLFVEYEQDFGVSFDPVRLKRRALISNISAYIFCCTFSISTPFLLTTMSKDSYYVRSLLLGNSIVSSRSSYMRAYVFPVIILTLFLVCGLAVCLVNVYFLLCHVTGEEVTSLHESLLRQTRSQVSEGDIGRHRIKFERIVRIVDKINACIYHSPAIAISLSLALFCFLLYGLVQGHMLVEDVAMSIGFLIVVLVLAGMMIGFGITIHEKMHAPLETLYSLDLDKMSEKAGIQYKKIGLQYGHLGLVKVHGCAFVYSHRNAVSIFINRLSTHPLGISVYGFFVIERSTILMMFGTVLTYFVVMIQMNPSNSDQCDLQTIIDMLNATKP